MSSILIGLSTLVLVMVCILLVLVILMQRPNANSGMGATLGGGAAEGVFGGETGNVLTRVTVKLTVLFFVLSAAIYFGFIYAASGSDDSTRKQLSISSVGAKAEQAATATPAAPAAPAAQAPVAPATTPAPAAK